MCALKVVPVDMWHFVKLLNVLVRLFSVKDGDPGVGRLLEGKVFVEQA